MFVNFDRAVTNSLGDTTGSCQIAVNPGQVAAVHSRNGNENESVIKLSDGRGFFVKGTYDETVAKLPPPFAEFDRPARPVVQDLDDEFAAEGEDDGIGSNVRRLVAPTAPNGKLAIYGPQFIAAVFGDAHDSNVTILRFATSAGYKVRGTFEEVTTQLLRSVA